MFEKVKTVISMIEFSLQLIIYLLKRNAEKDTSNWYLCNRNRITEDKWILPWWICMWEKKVIQGDGKKYQGNIGMNSW